MVYRTLMQSVQKETEIKRSRFISIAFPAESAEDAEEKLTKLRAEHTFATHVCYGYVSDTLGNVARFSDAGEPKGTAGLPILDAIRKRGLVKTVVAVVRYFGGIKLGAGGLTRAYANAAGEALDLGTPVTMGLAELFTAVFDYETAAKIKAEEEIGRNYGDAVEITFAAFDGREALENRLASLLARCVTLNPAGTQWRIKPDA